MYLFDVETIGMLSRKERLKRCGVLHCYRSIMLFDLVNRCHPLRAILEHFYLANYSHSMGG